MRKAVNVNHVQKEENCLSTCLSICHYWTTKLMNQSKCFFIFRL